MKMKDELPGMAGGRLEGTTAPAQAYMYMS
jgi:hypothetical protein